MEIPHRRYGQTSAKIQLRCTFCASHAPNCGPRNIETAPTTSSPPTTTINPIASNLVCQNGRVSGTSYATLSDSIKLANPPEADHSVPRIPTVKKLPLLG